MSNESDKRLEQVGEKLKREAEKIKEQLRKPEPKKDK